MKKIAIFNHKGGVSKTTSSFNLGWALSNKNKKVLLVDADSQCNLTMYSLGAENYEKYYDDNPTQNINSLLYPAFKSQPKLIDAAECVKINPNMYLLPGHIDFTENEVQLGISMQLSNAFGSMMNLPGAINYLIAKTSEKYGIDIVIIDMNPSLSAINQDLFITSDFFIIPTSPDLFSVMSIDSLSRVLVNWEKWGKSARPLFSESTYPLPNSTPKFLGYTINDFNLSRGKPQKSFRDFMEIISNKITENLCPSLAEQDMLLPKSHYDEAYNKMKESSREGNINYDDPYCLAQISNFNKLIAVSNDKSKPIFELDVDDVSNFDGQKKTLNWFKFLYNVLSDRILELMNV